MKRLDEWCRCGYRLRAHKGPEDTCPTADPKALRLRAKKRITITGDTWWEEWVPSTFSKSEGFNQCASSGGRSSR